jgi:hypothetical protein
MPESEVLKLDIAIDSWIISDGNYEDFQVGETRNFALEFCTPTLVRTNQRVASLRQQPYYSYSISGELIFATEDVTVIDCGVLAYSEQKCIVDKCVVGDFVQGDLTFGVDPFFYFEKLCHIPGIPALIYSWQINSIEQDTTPYILSEIYGRTGYIRDETRRSFKAVRGTDENVTIPTDICPGFVLHCTKLGMAPQHKLSLINPSAIGIREAKPRSPPSNRAEVTKHASYTPGKFTLCW